LRRPFGLAVAASEIWHMPSSTFEALAGHDPDLARFLHRQFAEQHSRAILQVAAGEPRPDSQRGGWEAVNRLAF